MVENSPAPVPKMFLGLPQVSRERSGPRGLARPLPVFGAQVSAMRPDQPAVALGYCFRLSFGASEGVDRVTWNGNHDDL